MSAWGTYAHAWGWQPNWNIEVLRNTFTRSQGLSAHTGCGYAVPQGAVNFTGAINSAIVFRGNTLFDGKGLTVSGRSTDVLVEGTSLRLNASFTCSPSVLSGRCWKCGDRRHVTRGLCNRTVHDPSPDQGGAADDRVQLMFERANEVVHL